jgi:hypothetical protein
VLASTFFSLPLSVGGRRPETIRREHGWDNPGGPGKGWRQLVPSSPPPRKRNGRHISPVPLAGVVSGQSTHELGTVRQGAIRNRAESSQAHGTFRSVRRRSYPRGFWLLLRRPERSRGARRDDPARRPSPFPGQGAQGIRDGGELPDLGKVREPPRWCGAVKRHRPAAKAKGNLRDKRSDP